MKDFIKRLLYIVIDVLPLACMTVPAAAQSDSHMKAVMAMVGASSEEELDEQEMERFDHFLSHPLRINIDSRSKLLSSGLMSRYQVASLEDYRSRNGDVLSFSELSMIEGFNPEYVAALKPFLSLVGQGRPGEIPDSSISVRNDAMARVTVKADGLNYGAKYRLTYGEKAELMAAGRTPSSWSAGMVFYGSRRAWKAVMGDYNLRFGQGLTMWSGLSLTGFSSSSSFYRRPTGLSPSFSWSGTGSHRGVAADCQIGRFVLTSFASFPGLRDLCDGRKCHVSFLGGVNLGYFGRNGQISVTAFGERGGGAVSTDFRFNHKGFDFFGETAFDVASDKVAVTAGSVIPLGGGWKLSGVARYYPSDYKLEYSGGVRSWTRTSDEIGAAFGLERHGFRLTADFARKDSGREVRQCKVLAILPFQVCKTVVVSFRFTERYRPNEDFLKFKTGARMDIDWSSSGISARYGESDDDAWKVRCRAEGMLYRSSSGLAYLEIGRKTEMLSAYVRGTVFLVDYWDDRIYSYERDVPGSFTVPAYYGRGLSLSAAGGYRFRFGERKRKTLKLNLRVSSVCYPFMNEPKPSVMQARFQTSASF